MANEDFLDGTWHEVDPNSHITVTSSRVSEMTLKRNEDAYVYKDKGIGHFNGDFSHNFTIRSPTLTNGSGAMYVYGLSNTLDDGGAWAAHSIYVNLNNDNTYVMYLGIVGVGNAAYATLETAHVYYATLDRIGTTVRIRLWHDEARTDLRFTRTVVDASPISARYIYVMSSLNGNYDILIDGVYHENLNLGEVTTYTPTYSIDAIFNKLGITKTNQIDTLFQKLGVPNAYSIDTGFKKIDISKSNDLDLALEYIEYITKTYDLDTLFLKEEILSPYNLDAILHMLGLTFTEHFIDLLFKKLDIPKSIQIDLMYEKIISLENIIDLLLAKRTTRSHSIDILFSKLEILKSYLIDIIFAHFRRYSIDIDLLKTRQRIRSIDLLFRQLSVLKSSYIDSSISKPITEGRLIDAIFGGRSYGLDYKLWKKSVIPHWQRVNTGKTAKMFINGLEVGCCSGVSIEIKNGIEDYYGIESPIPTRIGEGTEEVTGSMKHAFVNVYYLRLMGLGQAPFNWNNNIPFDLLLEGFPDSGSPITYLYNCRFEKANIKISSTGFLEEEYDFISIGIPATGSVGPSGEQIVNGSFEDEIENEGEWIPTNWICINAVGDQTGTVPPDGTWWIKGTPGSSTFSVEQTLDISVSGSSITLASVWTWGSWNSGLGHGTKFTVEVYYTDLTYDSIEFETTIEENGLWVQRNFLSIIDISKTITTIKVLMNGTESESSGLIDWVRLII